MGTLNKVIITTVMAGCEGHRGWINYLAVQPEFQRCGFGRKLMMRAESALKEIGCPKINLFDIAFSKIGGKPGRVIVLD